jgi:hypothetical protein
MVEKPPITSTSVVLKPPVQVIIRQSYAQWSSAVTQWYKEVVGQILAFFGR